MQDVEADDFVGMMEDDATVEAMNSGWAVRITRRDGHAFPATRDYRDDRINFNVDQNVVVAASFG